MNERCECGSYAINPKLHGRKDGVDLHLCDVCYWRKRANEQAAMLDEAVGIANSVHMTEFSGPVFKDVNGSNWFDARSVWLKRIDNRKNGGK